MEKTYLTPAEAMVYLSVSRNTLNKMVETGVIPRPARLGSRLIRFDRNEIDRYINENKNKDVEGDDPSLPE